MRGFEETTKVVVVVFWRANVDVQFNGDFVADREVHRIMNKILYVGRS